MEINREELERRLSNWWRFMHERDSLTDIAPSPTWRLTPRGRRAESTIPLLVGEALDTDAALKLLAKEQAAALVARYCTNGRRLDQARRLRIRVRKFYRLLELAEPAFFEALAEVRRRARIAPEPAASPARPILSR